MDTGEKYIIQGTSDTPYWKMADANGRLVCHWWSKCTVKSRTKAGLIPVEADVRARLIFT